MWPRSIDLPINRSPLASSLSGFRVHQESGCGMSASDVSPFAVMTWRCTCPERTAVMAAKNTVATRRDKAAGSIENLFPATLIPLLFIRRFFLEAMSWRLDALEHIHTLHKRHV